MSASNNKYSFRVGSSSESGCVGKFADSVMSSHRSCACSGSCRCAALASRAEKLELQLVFGIG